MTITYLFFKLRLRSFIPICYKWPKTLNADRLTFKSNFCDWRFVVNFGNYLNFLSIIFKKKIISTHRVDARMK